MSGRGQASRNGLWRLSPCADPVRPGHCVYCGGYTTGHVCHAHADLPKKDPAYDPNANILPRRRAER